MILTREDGHQCQGGNSSTKHGEPRVLHGHNCRDEERLIAQLRYNDDGERGDESVNKSNILVECFRMWLCLTAGPTAVRVIVLGNNL